MADTLTLSTDDGLPLFVYRWSSATPPRAAVQIVHGMAEHAGRYDELAQALNRAGYAVYAHDQRGHGRTRLAENPPGDLGPAGWRGCLDDIGTVKCRIADDFPGVPLVLLGHSMGAFLAQQFAGEKGEGLRGLVLCGTYRESRPIAWAGARLARFETKRLGAHGHSPLIRRLTFDAFNPRFAPNRTPFDWLSRDSEEVDRYVADPHCGFPTPVALWSEVLNALSAGLPLPPRDLPTMILVGEKDPICGSDPGAKKLAAFLQSSGCTRLTHRAYPGARHELFHETNRAEVMRDLIAWLDAIIESRESRLTDLNR